MENATIELCGSPTAVATSNLRGGSGGSGGRGFGWGIDPGKLFGIGNRRDKQIRAREKEEREKKEIEDRKKQERAEKEEEEKWVRRDREREQERDQAIQDCGRRHGVREHTP